MHIMLHGCIKNKRGKPVVKKVLNGNEWINITYPGPNQEVVTLSMVFSLLSLRTKMIVRSSETF